MGFFWGAYGEKAFSDTIMSDLGPLTFRQAMTDMIGTAAYDWVVEHNKPIGLFLGNSIAGGRGVEVQVDWMPWASPRERLEATAVFLREIPKQLKVFIFASTDDEKFYSRLCRYRLLRNGCKVTNYFGAGEDAVMYYSVGPH